MIMKMIVQCDFDGTISTDNISILLREEFATGDWRQIDSDYMQGKLTVEDSNQRQFAMIKEPRDKLVSFAREKAQVKAGFLEFVDYCRNSGIEFVIVSSGLDFYIEAVLEQIGVPNLELYCARTSFGRDGIDIEYIDLNGNRVEKGFKLQCFNQLKLRGEYVIYLGDGFSDLEAASAADYVFATGSLTALLDKKSVSYHSFTDFHDVLRQMPRLDS
ncbi:MtnX-like HAD-IB family phosphatase [Bacteroidota bacterium]